MKPQHCLWECTAAAQRFASGRTHTRCFSRHCRCQPHTPAPLSSLTIPAASAAPAATAFPLPPSLMQDGACAQTDRHPHVVAVGRRRGREAPGPGAGGVRLAGGGGGAAGQERLLPVRDRRRAACSLACTGCESVWYRCRWPEAASCCGTAGAGFGGWAVGRRVRIMGRGFALAWASWYGAVDGQCSLQVHLFGRSGGSGITPANAHGAWAGMARAKHRRRWLVSGCAACRGV